MRLLPFYPAVLVNSNLDCWPCLLFLGISITYGKETALLSEMIRGHGLFWPVTLVFVSHFMGRVGGLNLVTVEARGALEIDLRSPSIVLNIERTSITMALLY